MKNRGGVTGKISNFFNVVIRQTTDLSKTKLELIGKYTDLKDALTEYLGGEGRSSRHALFDSPHSFHRITGTKKALAIVKDTIKDEKAIIDISKDEFSPRILES